MIVSQAFNLRDNWAQINPKTLLSMIHEDHSGCVDRWKVVGLQRIYTGGRCFRTYIVSSEGGSLYYLSMRSREDQGVRLRDLEHIAALHGGRVYPSELKAGPGIYFSQDRGADVCDVITTAVDCGLVGAQVSPVPRGFIVCWPHLQGATA